MRDALAVSAAFASGAVLPLAGDRAHPPPGQGIGDVRHRVGGAGTNRMVSARISQIHPVFPMLRRASVAGLALLITYLAGHLLYP